MLEKYPGERAVFYINCAALLGTNETIAGTPALVGFPKPSTGSAALLFESITVNSEAVTLPGGVTVAAGKLITVTISGGQSATDKDARAYSVVATFNTHTGNTLVSKSALSVLPVGPTE